MPTVATERAIAAARVDRRLALVPDPVGTAEDVGDEAVGGLDDPEVDGIPLFEGVAGAPLVGQQAAFFEMSGREKRRLKIDVLPSNLSEALDCLEKDDVLKNALGDHVYEHFQQAKRSEWETYISRVHPWEIETYLKAY